MEILEATEIWKSVKDYEGYYEISNCGNIRSVERFIETPLGKRRICSKDISIRMNNWGYLEVRLSKNGRTTTKPIHVLLAQVFIPNPNNKQEVNHKDGIKTHNQPHNLEWVTHSENIKHAYEYGLIIKKSKFLFDKCCGKIFSSTKEASEFYGINYNTLRNYLNGGIKRNPTCLQYKEAA